MGPWVLLKLDRDHELGNEESWLEDGNEVTPRGEHEQNVEPREVGWEGYALGMFATLISRDECVIASWMVRSEIQAHTPYSMD